MLLARKNLIFEAIGQLNESNAPPMPSEDRHPGLAVFVCVCVSLSLSGGVHLETFFAGDFQYQWN